MSKLTLIFLITKLALGLICQDILLMPDERRLNLQELQIIPPNEIADCLTHLGRREMGRDEADFIWNTLIEFYKGVGNIPEEVLAELHFVTVAIQPEEYPNITMGNIDVIHNFGLDYGLNDDQLQAIANRVREEFGAKKPEDYTFYDLKALRQILCAFDRSEIEKIHPKAYKEAASVIGKLKKCNRDVMQGFAQLATQKGAFGSPSLWPNITVQTVGAVLEYLPTDVVARLKTKLGINMFIVDQN